MSAVQTRRALLLALAATLAGCNNELPPHPPPLPQTAAQSLGSVGAAQARINGDVGSTDTIPPPQVSYGTPPVVAMPSGAAASEGGGAFSLDFADTDIREVAAQILGTMLKVDYTIDPSIHGSATLRTVAPLTRSQLLPALQTLLHQNAAALTESDGIFHVVPAAAAGNSLAGSPNTAGGVIMPLHYASAEDLAKVLQPFVGNGGRIAADAGRNALIIAGDPTARETLVGLVRAFDVDVLAGQSYALLPVTAGGAKDFASALQDAFRSQSGGALAGQVRVVPMERVNAVLVVSGQRRYVDDARHVYALIERARRDTLRSWHVYYLQNSRANDIAYVLQQAFTPGDVTAQPSSSGPGSTAPGFGTQQMNNTQNGSSNGTGGLQTGSETGGLTGGTSGSNGLGTGGLGSSAASGGIAGQQAGQAAGGQTGQAAANPLLGGLGGGNNGAETDTTAMRIIPDNQNNAVLIYATQREEDTIQAMLRKIDILPLQVRIDATIAEVTLNDALQYGTQFFFKSGGINGILSNASQSLSSSNLSAATFNTGFPGFVIGGSGLSGAPLAISALQAVTKVNVLSSPELLVLDNHAARLQVGNLVPYLTQSSQSTITSNSPVINSVEYRQTGVIMQVIPRVNSGGLVTLDISQEVSDVDTSAPQTQGLNSPTFLERNVTSRVVVQDGQTVGLAGLIRDSVSQGNQGIPFLKDIPLLGFLAGSQTNSRQRTELLVLITPHVVHDQRDAAALTQDLRDQLPQAAITPAVLQKLPPSGSPDPGASLRHRLR